MNKIFLSFADSRMTRALSRIGRQAEVMGVYDQIICATEVDLDKEFRDKFREYLKPSVKGYGYWCWKPQIIKQTLCSMSDGDLLQYTDAGCHLNLHGKNRLLDYFAIASQSSSGILAFQAVPSAMLRQHFRRKLPDLSEYKWCKGDLFDYFGVRGDSAITRTQTIGAGIIFLRKSSEVIEFVDQWLSVYSEDFSLIDDSASLSKNFDGFVEHRHDQSLFSILCKIGNVDCESAYEYWFPSKGNVWKADWKILRDFPIHAKRDKGMRFLEKISLTLLTRGRRILNFMRMYWMQIIQ